MYIKEIPKAIGIDIEGNQKVFISETYVIGNNIIFASDEKLSSLKVDENVHSLYCYKNNCLKEISLPQSIERAYIGFNNLEHIDIPHNMIRLDVRFNNLKEIKIPESLIWLSCDKELFDYDKCNIRVVEIYYQET
jgi:hypothetical protein